MTVLDYYDHITFDIPGGEQLTSLEVTGLVLAENYTIIYRIQQDTDAIVDVSANFYASDIVSSDLNTNLLDEALTGGYPSSKGGDGTSYAMLFYLVITPVIITVTITWSDETFSYYMDGVQQDTLDLDEGNTYVNIAVIGNSDITQVRCGGNGGLLYMLRH
jgi:hypothetical protein